MIRLIESGLFGNRLVPVKTSLMVDRYNSALADIGLEKTQLKSFHIDGWGWSPEVAEEQKNTFYLSHGMANPYGIIISPEQQNASIYHPFHTFDWDVHKRIFSEYGEQITDITTQSAIWFELDQEISAYRHPADLLMIDVFTIHFNTVDRIMEAAREQRNLIHKFMVEENAWADAKLREAIINSSNEFGDLRYRSIELRSIPFGNYLSFYTLAFDGLYVFRNLKNKRPLLVFKNNSSEISGEKHHDQMEFNLSDNGLLPYLTEQGLLENDADFYIRHPYLIELKMMTMLMSACRNLKKLIPTGNNERTHTKMLVQAAVSESLLNDKYFELERLVLKIKNRQTFEIPEIIKEDLLYPAPHLNQNDKIVLWHLLACKHDNDVVIKYLFDKSGFYAEYGKWKEDFQEWAVETILEHRFIFQQITQ
ncbi:MAG: hypothetical protein GC181_09755 [Bacteroidetes bacterium]|nr:hypothetical protein [Bacteroidota bacterium]